MFSGSRELERRWTMERGAQSGDLGDPVGQRPWIKGIPGAGEPGGDGASGAALFPRFGECAPG